MKLRLLTLAAFAAANIVSAAAQDMPDLVGTWQGKFKAQLADTVISGTLSWTVDSQDGELFTAHKAVVRDDDSEALMSANGEMVRDTSEKFIGVIAADGTGFHIAEIGDAGWYIGRVVDADTIEVTYVESGDAPVVHRTTLNRQ